MKLKLAIVAIMCSPLFMLSQTLNDFSYSITQSIPTVNSSGDSVVVFSCVILANDSLNVSAVELQMGTFPGSSNVLNQTFVVGQNFGLPNSCTITTSVNTITLGLGYNSPGVYHFRVKLFDNAGNSSGFLLYNSDTGQYTQQL